MSRRMNVRKAIVPALPDHPPGTIGKLKAPVTFFPQPGAQLLPVSSTVPDQDLAGSPENGRYGQQSGIKIKLVISQFQQLLCHPGPFQCFPAVNFFPQKSQMVLKGVESDVTVLTHTGSSRTWGDQKGSK